MEKNKRRRTFAPGNIPKLPVLRRSGNHNIGEETLKKMINGDSKVESIHELATKFIQDVEVSAKGNKVGEIPSPSTDIFTESLGKLASKLTDAIIEKSFGRKGKSGTNMRVPVKETHTKIITGVPNPKIFRTLSKQNGTITKWLFDTNIVYSGEDGKISRSGLTEGYGFNCKGVYILPPLSYVTLQDLVQVMGFAPNEGKSNLLEREWASAAIKNVRTQFKIHNDNSFLKMKMQIHLIDCTDSAAMGITSGSDRTSYPKLLSLIFKKQVSGDGSTVNNATQRSVPHRFLFRDNCIEEQSYGTADDGNSLNIDSKLSLQYTTQVSLKTKFAASENFRSAFKLAKTISRTLEPGETWFVDHKHLCGAGIDAFKVYKQSQNTDALPEITRPAAYMYMITANGVPVQAVHFDGNAGQYTSIGTSAGFYSIEWRKGLTYISNQKTVGADIGAGGITNDAVLLRQYQTLYNSQLYSAANQEEFHRLPENIVYRDTDILTNKTLIPVSTDQQIKFEYTKTGQDPV